MSSCANAVETPEAEGYIGQTWLYRVIYHNYCEYKTLAIHWDSHLLDKFKDRLKIVLSELSIYHVPKQRASSLFRR